jgi:hypothetical protein
MFVPGGLLCSTKNRRAQHNKRGGEKLPMFEKSLCHQMLSMVILAKEAG